MMCEGKMHRVLPDLEYKCIAEDSQGRVCLPTVRREENKAEKDSGQERVVGKQEFEELLGTKIPDRLFQEAVAYAKRKQRYIYDQNGDTAVMEYWYLVKLTEEYVRHLSLSKLTMDVCRTLHDMEKEHSAKSQSAQLNTHIVAGFVP